MQTHASVVLVVAVALAYSLQGRVTGFNSWHGSTLENPKGWDKNGDARRFKVDMAGIAFNAVMAPRFTGPRYGYHETDIVEQTGVVELVRDSDVAFGDEVVALRGYNVAVVMYAWPSWGACTRTGDGRNHRQGATAWHGTCCDR